MMQGQQVEERALGTGVLVERAAMFDSIAARYDVVNTLLSIGLDAVWRRRLVAEAQRVPHGEVIDLACGSGVLSMQLARELKPKSILGCDISPRMLAHAERKVERKGLGETIRFARCAAEELQAETESADLVTIAFGARNFADVAQGMREVYRVLRPGGTLMVLEFAWPRRRWIQWGYQLYSQVWLRLLGGLLTGNFRAYSYLPKSIRSFCARDYLGQAVQETGLNIALRERYTAGVVELLVARK